MGLPHGQMGTSEVGHLNIGAGRIVYQSLVKISKAIDSGEIKKNKVFTDLLAYARQGKPLHLMGLVSPGGVHSHTDHLYGFLRLAKEAGLTEVYIHAFLDGRDTPPASAVEYLQELEEKIREIGVGRIATVAGRYYAMDRDKRWDRTEKAMPPWFTARGTAASAVEAVGNSYARGVTDEFVSGGHYGERRPVPSARVMRSSSSISGRTGPARSPRPLSTGILRVLPAGKAGSENLPA